MPMRKTPGHTAPRQSGCDCDDTADLEQMLSVQQGVDLAVSLVAPIADMHDAPIIDAVGQSLAQDVLAPAEMPFFDNSAMDGFAVRCADFTGSSPWTFPLGAQVAAGATMPGALRAACVDRIFTGAPLPAGSDAVVMVEKTRETPDGIRFDSAPDPGDNIRPKGSDIKAGACLIRAGTRLAPHHVGLLAANGVGHVPLRRAPRVGVLSTGDEVTETQREDGQIYDANRPMLCALARAAGAQVSDLGILPDDAAQSAQRLAEAARQFDLVLTSGAVSMGGHDFLRPALVAAGGTVEGWRVTLKPGKPVMFARLGSCVVTGLPGNPLAVLVGFHLFVAAQLRRLAGRDARAFAAVPARAGFSWQRKPGRDEVFPVRLSHYSDAGLPVLIRLGQGVSGTLVPVAQADGLGYVAGTVADVQPGDALRWQPFADRP